jgi:hypothetical protein
MKNIILLLMLSIKFSAYCQVIPPNDTIIPEQQLNDTVKYQPKLKGGALIDTINTKGRKDYPAYPLHDSIPHRKQRLKS